MSSCSRPGAALLPGARALLRCAPSQGVSSRSLGVAVCAPSQGVSLQAAALASTRTFSSSSSSSSRASLHASGLFARGFGVRSRSSSSMPSRRGSHVARCGVMGVHTVGGSASAELYEGLLMLQHRGQDSAGIVTADGDRLYERKDNGLVKDVFSSVEQLQKLPGSVGLGHVRYPTAGSSSAAEAQPFFVNSPLGIYLIHNGNITNEPALRARLAGDDSFFRRCVRTRSDSEVLLNVLADEMHRAHARRKRGGGLLQEAAAHLGQAAAARAAAAEANRVLAHAGNGGGGGSQGALAAGAGAASSAAPAPSASALEVERMLFESVAATERVARGAYACVCLLQGVGLLGFRDPFGIRPLVLGHRLSEDGRDEWALASEDCAFGPLGYRRVRDVSPGEAVLIAADGRLVARRVAVADPATGDVFAAPGVACPEQDEADLAEILKRGEQEQERERGQERAAAAAAAAAAALRGDEGEAPLARGGGAGGSSPAEGLGLDDGGCPSPPLSAPQTPSSSSPPPPVSSPWNGDLATLPSRLRALSLATRPTPLTPCIFEYIYLARPDSTINDIPVYEFQSALGTRLARRVREAGWDIDIVCPVPDGSRPAAVQISHELGIPYREGLVKNRYVGRTFIMPDQRTREASVRRKLNATSAAFRGRKVLLVDDSIVRGTTMRQIVDMVRQAGATHVYLASASPPVRHPNVYGVDMPSKSEFVANDLDESEICAVLRADGLIYQTVDDLVGAGSDINPHVAHFDDSCFTGRYITGDIDDLYLERLANKGRGKRAGGEPNDTSASNDTTTTTTIRVGDDVSAEGADVVPTTKAAPSVAA